jgi:flagellar biosynthesis protein FlhB
MADPSKTEKATPKKKREFRKKGSVAKSQEVNTLFTLLTAYFVLKTFGMKMFLQLREATVYYLSNIHLVQLERGDLSQFFYSLIWRIVLLIMPTIGFIIVVVLIVNIAQVGFLLSKEAIKPSLGKINPISGAKRLMGKESLVTLFKTLAKVGLSGYMAYTVIRDNVPLFFQFFQTDLLSSLILLSQLALKVLLKIILAYIIIAAFDYAFQKYSMNEKMKMSKQDVKEEHKRSEGDPKIKGAIRQKQREMAQQRMMSEVPDADVVVTNPIHVAVALKYDSQTMSAPKITAKGARLLAQEIKDIAKENNVPIVENPPLARALYKAGNVDEAIPSDLFTAVADVLTYVYKISGKKFGLD